MKRINVLPELVANQIAAGEVIDRPASVLKELLENALDAQATQIDVIMRGGGSSLIQVTDNGFGMNADDALLCLERHATSKLRTSEDLARIDSYGFRGEAIPSIASVSKFRLSSREPDQLSGTEIVVEGGKLRDVRDCGMAPGTQVEVRHLFFNVPARRKFLRSETTEQAHLKNQLILTGLARPGVGFSIRHGAGNELRWPSGQDRATRVSAILGMDLERVLLPIEAEQDNLHLSGFIGQPGVNRASRADHYLFVNQRPITNRVLQWALQEGYAGALPKNRYPVAILFLQINPSLIDVNIHPAKREIRFHDEPWLRQFIQRAIHERLREYTAAPISVNFAGAHASTSSEKPLPLSRRQELSAPHQTRHSPPAPPPSATELVVPPHLQAVIQGTASLQPSLDLKTPPSLSSSETSSPQLALQFLSLLSQSYLLAESEEGLVLIDQRAAHERILFEQILNRMEQEEVISQHLLLPLTLKLTPQEAAFLEAQITTLNAMGIQLSPFGTDTYLVDALPPFVPASDVENFMRTLLADLLEISSETRKKKHLHEEAIASAVSRQVARLRRCLQPNECEKLLNDLLQCHLPYTCPRGKPTMIQFSFSDLERKFGRR